MSDSSDRILRIRRLIGPAVLLPWPTGSKGDRRKWGHLQLTNMDETAYRDKLQKAGNIGVVLGKVSNGLVTIDLDQNSYVDIFVAANPLLSETLRTRGRRGCNIWLRCGCEYPRSRKIKNELGAEIGEWRADGNQTIISGTHPYGMPYRFVVEQPVTTISYDAITWPKGILPPCTTSAATESKRVRRVRENEVVGGGLDSVVSSVIEGISIGDLVSQLAPKDFGQNNDSVFKLARLIISYESAIGRSATDAERDFFFDRWALVSRQFWRHSRDEYYAEFLEACIYARVGLDQDPIEVAMSRAKAAPLPDVPGFRDERIRLLAAICQELNRIMPGSPFFLPTRKLGALLGAHWTIVARWLRAFEFKGIVHLATGEVRIRGGTRSPRYCYGPREPGLPAQQFIAKESQLLNAAPVIQ
jgi:hypothetical protein